MRKDGGSIVLVTKEDRPVSKRLLLDKTDIPSNIQLFTLAFPAFDSMTLSPPPTGMLSTYYRVKESGSTLSSLTDCLLDVLNKVSVGSRAPVQKLFQSHHMQHEFSGSFFVEEVLPVTVARGLPPAPPVWPGTGAVFAPSR